MNFSQTISRPQQQHRYEQPDLHPEHLLHGKVGIFLGPQGKPNLAPISDGIPIRAGDDVDGDVGEELQYEWSTEGEREIEPERESPRVVADQVDFMISSCDVKLSSICYRIIATGASTDSRS